MNIFLMKKLIMYYKVIKEVLNINDIPSSVHCKGFITQKLNIQEKKKDI